jgi:hypothetical protein
VEFLGVMLLKRLVPGECLPASPFATCVLAVVVFSALVALVLNSGSST